MKLTEKAIAALDCPAGRKDRMVFDDVLPGLALRVTAGGGKAFLAQYTTGAGQRRRVPLGRWGAIGLEQARQAARAILGAVARGDDPAAVRAATRRQAKAEAEADKLTLDALLDQWAALALADRRERYRAEALRAMRFAFPAFRNKPVALLTREAVLKVLDGLIRGGSVTMGARTQAYGRACFTWARRRGMVPDNPFADLPIATNMTARDRVLSAGEVAAIWQALGALGPPFGPLLRILLLTAQRRSEVGEMRWSELSADRTTWTIPKERAKNGRAHVVHLAPAVRGILAGIERVERPDGKQGELSDLVFTTNGRTPVSGFTRPKDRVDELVAAERARAAGAAKVLDEHRLAPWRLHDFRRTAVTWMAENGVAPHVADRILNHVQGTISGVAAVYQRGEFLAERKTALEAWAALVAGGDGSGTPAG